MFPADHVIADEKAFRKAVEQAVEIAAAGENMVVMGIKPTRPETGYGYIEAGERARGVYRVMRFTEKPNLEKAARVRRSRQLLLEQRHIRMERAHPGKCSRRTFLRKRAAPGEDRRRLRLAQLR